jgi:copper(I)-binding protein
MTRTLRAACAAALFALPAFAGEITISEPFARATPPGAGASAAYMTITSAGEDDRLIAARSDVARRVELHTHILEDGIARMREVEGGIALPAGEAVTLAPGGLHVMLMGLNAQLIAGEEASLTLVFDKAGEIVVDAPIRDLSGSRPAMGGMGHGQDHGAPQN